MKVEKKFNKSYGDKGDGCRCNRSNVQGQQVAAGATGGSRCDRRDIQGQQVAAGATGGSRCDRWQAVGRRLAGGWQAELAGRVGRHLSWQASELAGI